MKDSRFSTLDLLLLAGLVIGVTSVAIAGSISIPGYASSTPASPDPHVTHAESVGSGNNATPSSFLVPDSWEPGSPVPPKIIWGVKESGSNTIAMTLARTQPSQPRQISEEREFAAYLQKCGGASYPKLDRITVDLTGRTRSEESQGGLLHHTATHSGSADKKNSGDSSSKLSAGLPLR